MENQAFFNVLVGDHFADVDFKNLFNSIVKTKVFSNHQILLKKGEVSKYVWFINEGFAMTYIIKEGKKVPLLFWDKNELILSMNSLLKQQPSESNIEVLEKSNLSFIHYDDFSRLMQSYQKMRDAVQNRKDQISAVLEKRIVDLLSSSAEERYKNLLFEFPVITLKAPVELIASYLGISRKTLNRIRTKGLRRNIERF